MIAYGEPIKAWVSEKTGYTFGPADQAIGYTKDGVIRAGIVFQHWNGADVELTAAGDEFPRSLLRAAYRYAVGQLGCRRVTFKTPADHAKAIETDIRLGARLEGVQRGFTKYSQYRPT